MKKLSSSLPHMILSLGIITLVAGAVLAIVYDVTKEPIANVDRQKKIDAIAAVVPHFDNDPMTDTRNIDGCTAHIARNGGEFVGAAIEVTAPQGFSGPINLIVGFDSEGNLSGFNVINHSETPGLGAKMNDWFRDPAGNRSIIGRNLEDAELMVSKDGGQVDGITAATITSRAFLGAINHANQVYRKLKTELK